MSAVQEKTQDIINDELRKKLEAAKLELELLRIEVEKKQLKDMLMPKRKKIFKVEPLVQIRNPIYGKTPIDPFKSYIPEPINLYDGWPPLEYYVEVDENGTELPPGEDILSQKKERALKIEAAKALATKMEAEFLAQSQQSPQQSFPYSSAHTQNAHVIQPVSSIAQIPTAPTKESEVRSGSWLAKIFSGKQSGP